VTTNLEECDASAYLVECQSLIALALSDRVWQRGEVHSQATSYGRYRSTQHGSPFRRKHVADASLYMYIRPLILSIYSHLFVSFSAGVGCTHE